MQNEYLDIPDGALVICGSCWARAGKLLDNSHAEDGLFDATSEGVSLCGAASLDALQIATSLGEMPAQKDKVNTQ